MVPSKRVAAILVGFIFSLTAACSHNTEQSKSKSKSKEISGFFENICAGRYSLDVPISSEARTGYFGNDAFHFSFSKRNKVDKNATSIITGHDRFDIWKDRVEYIRKEDDPKIKYISKQLEGATKHLSYYSLFTTKSTSTHMLDTYFFRNISLADLSISSQMNFELTEFDLSNKNYKIEYSKNLDYALSKQEEIIYQPWPHNQLGICLNNEVLINSVAASEGEIFSVMWHNGKNSLIELESKAYPAGSSDALEKKVSHKYGLLDFFASSKIQVANRQGRVIISGGKYSQTEVQFLWFSTDAKAGSTRFPYLKISGYVEMKDFPEIAAKGLNEPDLAIGWLKSIQVRENGMVGTR